MSPHSQFRPIRLLVPFTVQLTNGAKREIRELPIQVSIEADTNYYSRVDPLGI